MGTLLGCCIDGIETLWLRPVHGVRTALFLRPKFCGSGCPRHKWHPRTGVKWAPSSTPFAQGFISTCHMYYLAHSMSIKVVAQKVSIIKAPFGLSERRIELWFAKIEQNDNSCASFVHVLVNSSSPIVRQWIGFALVQIMACRLFGAKPLSKPLLGYCQLGP